MKKLFILTLSVTSILFCGSLCFAQILIEEGKVKLDVNATESISKSLNIYNTSKESIPVKVYWQDFQYVPPFDGTKNFSPAGSDAHSVSKWITFSPAEFVLPPNSRKELRYSIKVPEGVKGGYYGVLFFEKGVVDRESITGVNLITRVGCLFFLETKDKSKQSEISEMSIANKELHGNFLNKGDVIQIPQGIFYIMDKEGIVIDRGELQKFYLPPAKSAKFSVPLPKDLTEGSYTTVITFDLDEGDSVVKEVDFQNDPVSGIKILEQRN